MLEFGSQLPYLFGAFMVIWIGIFAYLHSVSSRQTELRREIEALREVLAKEETAVEQRPNVARGTTEELPHII